MIVKALLFIAMLGISDPTQAIVKPALPKTQADLLPGQACRSTSQAAAFKRKTGFPHGRPGWIIDHVCSLYNGGIDRPSNMQWQTKSESDAKDDIENTPLGKKLWCNAKNSTPTRQVFNCK